MDVVEVPAERRIPQAVMERHLAVLRFERLEPTRSAERRRTRWLAGGLVAGTAIYVAGAAVVLDSGPATNQSVVRCHSTLEPSDGDSFAGSTVARLASPGGPVPIEDALAACEDLWRQGVLIEGARNAQAPSGRSHSVPRLVGCVGRDGVAEIFPVSTEDGTWCASIGLGELISAGENGAG